MRHRCSYTLSFGTFIGHVECFGHVESWLLIIMLLFPLRDAAIGKICNNNVALAVTMKAFIVTDHSYIIYNMILISSGLLLNMILS